MGCIVTNRLRRGRDLAQHISRRSQSLSDRAWPALRGRSAPTFGGRDFADGISLSLSTGCFLTDLTPSTRKEFPTTNETVQEKWFRKVADGWDNSAAGGSMVVSGCPCNFFPLFREESVPTISRIRGFFGRSDYRGVTIAATDLLFVKICRSHLLSSFSQDPACSTNIV